MKTYELKECDAFRRAVPIHARGELAECADAGGRKICVSVAFRNATVRRLHPMSQQNQQNEPSGAAISCPTCGHCHPMGMGLGFCLCNDCALLWSKYPELLSPKNQTRLQTLKRRQVAAYEAARGK